MSIQAIETVYKGYHFRSRLEARWAVFFDTLGIEWEYEKEGYDLRGKLCGYQRDDEIFTIHAGKYAESPVKELCLPNDASSLYLPDFWLPNVVTRENARGTWIEVKAIAPTWREWCLAWALEEATAHPFLFAVGVPQLHTEGEFCEAGALWEAGGAGDYNMSFMICNTCGDVSIHYPYESNYRGCNKGCGWHKSTDHPVIRKAVVAARSARFEHGESGATL